MPIYFIIFGFIFMQGKSERGSRSLSLHTQQGGSLVFRNSTLNSSNSLTLPLLLGKVQHANHLPSLI